MMDTFDVAVVGLGAMGSATCLALADRRVSVVGFEASAQDAVIGSSKGSSRIIRKAYFENELFLRLLEDAFQGWRALEEKAGVKIYESVGLLHLGVPGSAMIESARKTASFGNVDLERLAPEDLARRCPAFRPPAGWDAFFEKEAGYLHAGVAVSEMRRLAREGGARLQFETEVEAIETAPGGGVVSAGGTSIRAKKVVLTVGPWIKQLKLPGDLKGRIGRELSLTRQAATWFEPLSREALASPGCPAFVAEYGVNQFAYGFPWFEADGLKAALHNLGPEMQDPNALPPWSRDRDAPEIKRALDIFMPDAVGDPISGQTCIYTNRDRVMFLVARDPQCESIIVGSPCSGHGFKFAPAIGNEVANLVCGYPSKLPEGFQFS